MYLPIPDDVKSRELALTYGIDGLNLIMVFEDGGGFDFYIAKPTAKTEPVAKIGRGQWWIEGRGDAQKLGLRSTEKTIGEQTSLIVTKDSRVGVNARGFERDAIEGIRVRRFDGADTWKFLD